MADTEVNILAPGDIIGRLAVTDEEDVYLPHCQDLRRHR